MRGFRSHGGTLVSEKETQETAQAWVASVPECCSWAPARRPSKSHSHPHGNKTRNDPCLVGRYLLSTARLNLESTRTHPRGRSI